MPERISGIVRELILKQHGREGLADAFAYGCLVIPTEDGPAVFLGAQIEVEVQSPDSEQWEKIPLPVLNPDGKISKDEILVFIGNSGTGWQSVHNKVTWRQNDFDNRDAPVRRGYSFGGGHRGGVRQATSPAALKALFRRPPRKYR